MWQRTTARPNGAKTQGATQAEAQRRIAQAAETGADTRDFSDLAALTSLPEGIGDLQSLRKLFAGDRRPSGERIYFSEMALSDISVVSRLNELKTLDFYPPCQQG